MYMRTSYPLVICMFSLENTFLKKERENTYMGFLPILKSGLFVFVCVCGLFVCFAVELHEFLVSLAY